MTVHSDPSRLGRRIMLQAKSLGCRHMTYFVAYIAAAAGFLLLDFLWLGFVAKGFYRQEIGALLLDQFNMVAAIGFASTAVRVLARSSSTQENMKQKNAATPIPAAMVGTNIFTKNAGNEYPST